MEIKRCKFCNSVEVESESRQLCKRCYGYLSRHNRLDEYPKANLYIRRLKKRYGERIVFEFELCMYNLSHNLSTVGRKYGFCRERARQIFNDLFGYENYKKSRGWLRRLIDDKARAINFHPKSKFDRVKKKSDLEKGFKGELMVYNKLKGLGFNVSYPTKRAPYDLIIDNLKIEVKTSITPTINGNSIAYRCCLCKTERKCSDFVIFSIPKINSFYIIPTSILTGLSIYIRVNPLPNKKLKYENYKNMWELLRTSDEEKKKIETALNKKVWG